jgi:OmcA/MtrC family decaheme c-type cytochrome
VRFALAHLETYSGGGDRATEFSRYVNEVDPVDPGYDSGGTLEAIDAAAGVHRYTFGTMLPADYDRSRTYTVGIQVDRNYLGIQRSANPVADAVPDGSEPAIRAGTSTAQCNNCHDPLRLHGNRREVRLCAMCHTEAAVDPEGNSIDLRVMIHKIHRGIDLPSVADGEPGAFYGIYSGFQDRYIKFAEKLEDGTVVGVAFPRPLQDCTSCHSGGVTSENYTTKASAAACAACHDDVNPSQVATAAGPPGTNHFQDRGFPDGQCALCHDPGGEVEFDVSVLGAHTVPEQSGQLAGVNAEITGISNTAPGQTPVVRFKMTDDAGTAYTDLSGFNRVAFTLAGPTTDYATTIGATAVGGGAGGTLSGPDGDGVFTYMFPSGLPADADGTWAIGLEARREVLLEAPMGEEVDLEEAAQNPVVTFQVGSDSAEVRRMVVDDMNCQSCHGVFSKGFSIHGNLRNRVEYCVLCHNANATDVGRRGRDAEAVAAGERTAQIDFKVMIHKIHTGEELNQKPYIIYGFGTPPTNFTKHDFAEVLFPGDRRNCEKCHLEGTQLLPPFPAEALGPVIAHLDPATGMQVIDGREGPIGAVCGACHDSDAAQAHIETQTAMAGGEACEVCHSEGRDVPVSEVHANEE